MYRKGKNGYHRMKGFETKVQYLFEKTRNNLEMEWYESGKKKKKKKLHVMEVYIW